MNIQAESPVTVTLLKTMKQAGDKSTCLTAYDVTFASLIDDAGVDILLVGDSLGMVVQGQESTLPVTVEDIVYHCRAVARGRRRALLVADMPFMSYSTPQLALDNAARLMREGHAQMVKLEGGQSQVKTVSRLAEQGIPVCAHLGLQPQSVYKLGGYKVQGRDDRTARIMLEDARDLQSAGADVLLLECVPSNLGAEITAALEIPVIGIGAGPDCDGQVLVSYDMLGITTGRAPRFVRDFMEDSEDIRGAMELFVATVKAGAFPGPEHCFT